MTITRRSLLKGAAAAGGLAVLGPRPAFGTEPGAAPVEAADLGLPQNAPVDTFVVVMMENRSFDHHLGWLPGAIADRQRWYLDKHQVPHQPFPLAPDWNGCAIGPDPSHSRSGGARQLGPNKDASGFVVDRDALHLLPIGYYDAEDLPVWKALTEQATIVDQYFCAEMTSTWPNRSYMHAASSGGRDSNTPPFTPAGYGERTIWEQCEDAGVSWAYYYSNLPFAGLYGYRLAILHADKFRHVTSFHADAAAGLLPQVCFVDPVFTTPGEGVGNDDHPLADTRLAQQFLSEVVGSFTRSPQFARGALFVNYDEWGGFFDSVIPPDAPHDDRYDQGTFGRRGFRTPAAIVSPYARKGAISSHLLLDAVFDHTSILKLIEWRFGLQPLTRRDAGARNIGELLDFDQEPVEVDIPAYTAPPSAYEPCYTGGDNLDSTDSAEGAGWTDLLEMGWFETMKLRTDYRLEDGFIS